MTLLFEAILNLPAEQVGVTTRRQLEALGLSADGIRAQLDGYRWQAWGRHVVVLHNGPLSRRQLMWAAVLDAGGPAALASHTALELTGFAPFAREAEAIDLLVPRGA